MLEQEEHTFGLRERAFPSSDMGSPQQMQTRGFIGGRGRSRKSEIRNPKSDTDSIERQYGKQEDEDRGASRQLAHRLI
jgi:hypothetical protein